MSAVLEILVVEDHDMVREELMAFLSRPGWAVRGADCGEEMDRQLRTCMADVLILDLNLPFEDGISIAKRVRATRPQMGIIILTARTRLSDRTSGYNHGADVFLTKPTNARELEAVIQNLSQRIVPCSLNSYVLDVRNQLLRAPMGREVSLTLAELEILSHLATAPEREADSEFLVAQLSKGHQLAFHRESLTVFVSRLRSKLFRELGEDDILKAIRGYGYKLTISIHLDV